MTGITDTIIPGPLIWKLLGRHTVLMTTGSSKWLWEVESPSRWGMLGPNSWLPCSAILISSLLGSPMLSICSYGILELSCRLMGRQVLRKRKILRDFTHSPCIICRVLSSRWRTCVSFPSWGRGIVVSRMICDHVGDGLEFPFHDLHQFKKYSHFLTLAFHRFGFLE